MNAGTDTARLFLVEPRERHGLQCQSANDFGGVHDERQAHEAGASATSWSVYTTTKRRASRRLRLRLALCVAVKSIQCAP